MMNTFRKMIGMLPVFEATIFLKGGQVIVLKVTELKTERNSDNSLSSVSWKLADDSAKILYLRLDDISFIHTKEL